MQLVVDIGNTRVKAAIFKQNELINNFVFKSLSDFLQSEIFKQYNISNCIIVTVVDNLTKQIEELKQKVPVLIYNSDTKTPLKNLYQSTHTLGPDRLASSVAANYLYPNQNTLVIDAGTCIKYNFVNDKNEFIGGAISPGIKMRFKALNSFTSRLPLLEPDIHYDKLIGTTSTENMLSGVELGAIEEVNGFINQYLKLFSNLKVVITGGDTPFFEKRLKNNIFADPFLILKGLNIILMHNINTPQL